MRRINLLLGITLAEMGGAQTVVREILAHLPENDYQVTVATGPGGVLGDQVRALVNERALPIHLEVLPVSRREISPVCDARLFLALRRIIRERKIDVAHFHSSKMGIVGRVAARTLGVPKIIYTVHGWGGLNEYQPRPLRAIFGMAEWMAGRCAHYLVCVSQADKDRGETNGWLPSGRGVLIYNGMPDTSHLMRTGQLRQELGIPADMPVIGTVARMTEAKAPDFLLRVAARLHRDGKVFALVMVGDGPLLEPTRRLVDDLDLTGMAHIVGARKDIPYILTDFDIFALLSRWEGLPLSLIEAMFASLPVVATDVGGVRELVHNEFTGLLVPPMDEEAASRALARLLDSPSDRQAYGMRGRELAKQRFTVKRMVEEYDRLYKS